MKVFPTQSRQQMIPKFDVRIKKKCPLAERVWTFHLCWVMRIVTKKTLNGISTFKHIFCYQNLLDVVSKFT